jgi:hypothetical protein
MLGWILVFVLMFVGGTLSSLRGDFGPAFGTTASVIFGFLLIVSAFTFLLRGRA